MTRTAPPEVDRLLQLRTCNHSAVSLAELTRNIGDFDLLNQLSL